MQHTHWKNWAVGGVVAVTIVAAGLFAAESVSAAALAQDAMDAPGAATLQLARTNANQRQRGVGNAGPAYRAGIEVDQLLAAALGVSLEELEAARETARTQSADAALAQAVADGKLTQEQADALKTLQGLGNGRFQHRLPFAVGDYDDYLAQALGVTIDELASARDAAIEAGIQQALAEGEITQEQADKMLMRLALHDYLQTEMDAAYQSAIQKAVVDGVITQEQADALLSQDRGAFGRGMRGDLPGLMDGMRGRGFDGGMHRQPGMRGGAMDGGFGPKTQSNNGLQNSQWSSL